MRWGDQNIKHNQQASPNAQQSENALLLPSTHPYEHTDHPYPQHPPHLLLQRRQLGARVRQPDLQRVLLVGQRARRGPEGLHVRLQGARRALRAAQLVAELGDLEKRGGWAG
jgi:hypothetical protein